MAIDGPLVSSLAAKVSAKTVVGKRITDARYVATTLYHYDVLKNLPALTKVIGIAALAHASIRTR